MAAPVLTDGVVTLTAPRLGDAEALLRGRSDPDVRKAWLGSEVADLPDAERIVSYAIQSWADPEGRLWSFAIRSTTEDPYLGSVVLHRSVRGPGGVLDVWLLPEHRGAGYGRRAVLLALGYAFDQRSVPWVDVEILPDNHASRRMTRDIGFVTIPGELRGFRGRPEITIPSRMTREDWQAR